MHGLGVPESQLIQPQLVPHRSLQDTAGATLVEAIRRDCRLDRRSSVRRITGCDDHRERQRPIHSELLARPVDTGSSECTEVAYGGAAGRPKEQGLVVDMVGGVRVDGEGPDTIAANFRLLEVCHVLHHRPLDGFVLLLQLAVRARPYKQEP